MKRERVQQIILAVVGLAYLALLYPLATELLHAKWLVVQDNNEVLPMFISFFIPLGVFLVLAARNPSTYRPLILFAAWQSIAHGSVMIVETVQVSNHGLHRNPVDIVVTLVIGVLLLAVLPAKQPTIVQRES